MNSVYQNTILTSGQMTLPSMKEVDKILKGSFSAFDLFGSISSSADCVIQKSTHSYNSSEDSEIIRIMIPLNDGLNETLPIICDESDSSFQDLTSILDNESKASSKEIEFIWTLKNQNFANLELSKISPSKTNSSPSWILSDSSSTKTKARTISFKSELTDNYSEWLATRWDVVYKTILRDFRRHYQTKFKASAKFTKRNKSKIYGQKLEEFTNTIWKAYFPEESSADNIAVCVKALIEPIKNEEFHSCLYKFSLLL